MKFPIGVIIVIGVLLLSIFLFTNFLFPDVICKIIPRSDVKTSAGQYNPNVINDICSGIRRD